MNLLGRGVYSFKEAADLTNLKPSRVREWFTDRSEGQSASIFKSDFDGQTSERLISFLDLIDVFIAGRLRSQGLSLQALRRNYKAIQDALGINHAFSQKKLLTDGKRLFIVGLDGKDREEVVDVLTKQKAFPKIILPFLKKLDFDPESHLATRWRISPGVVINPQICFGQPIVEGCGIPTNILAKAMKANKDVNRVAHWYGVSASHVTIASHFEARRAA